MPDITYFVNQCSDYLLKSSSDEAEKAREYLISRNLKKETVSRFKIGYCSSRALIPEEVKSFKKDCNWSDYSCFLNGKVIVPIANEFDEVVAIATRTPSKEKGHSWWNLPFSKGNNIFLLNKSRESVIKHKKIYIVEGYMDALTLFQAGLENVGALMGTNLTCRHIGLIARYCNNVCFCFDSDENQSGQNAQQKSIFLINEFGFVDNLSVIDDLPLGTDPDVFVSQYGLEEFLRAERVLSQKDIKKICHNVRAIKKK